MTGLTHFRLAFRRFASARIGAWLLLIAAPAALHSQNPTPSADKPPVLTVSRRDARKAEAAYLAGARFVDRHDLARALVQFKQAAALNSTRPEYAAALASVQDAMVADLVRQSAQARALNRNSEADALLAQARMIEPQSPMFGQDSVRPKPVILQRETSDNLQFAGAIQLAPAAGVHAFHLHGDVQEVVRQVADAYAIKASFDESVTRTDLKFALDEAPYGQVMPILLHMTHLFAVPLTERSILVVKDTQDNRQKFERQIEETIYVPGSTKEQMTELVNIVKNVFDVKQVSAQSDAGVLIVRAPASTLNVMNYTLADLIDGGAEVMLEFKLYEVDKSLTRNTGATLPSGGGAFSVAAEAQSIVSANQSTINQAIASGAITLTGNATQNLITEALFLVGSGLVTSTQVSGLLGLVGGGLTSLGIYQTGGASFNLALNTSDSRLIDDVQLRVADRETNTLRIGSKYPITTATYATGSSSSAISSLPAADQALLNKLLGTSTTGTTTTTPQVQYEDLGLTFKATPQVEKSGLVALHLELKIEALTGSSLDNNPILSSRALTSDVTLKDGTSAVIVSALTKSESGSLDGLPGLSELPGFQDATSVVGESSSTDLVMIVTPHVVRRRRDEIATRPIAFQSTVPVDY